MAPMTIKGRPLMYELCTQWNLPYHIKDELEVHHLLRMNSWDLNLSLVNGEGMLGFQGKQFVPIYQNTNRQDIIRDSVLDSKQRIPSRYYWLSFRSDGNSSFVLIQKDTKKK